MIGAVTAQGPHHIAEKSSITTLLLESILYILYSVGITESVVSVQSGTCAVEQRLNNRIEINKKK